MKDLLIVFLPFLIICICLSMTFFNYKKEKNTYCSEGMCFGMGFGLALSTALKIDIGLGLSLGMLIGETIGMFIERKNTNN